MAQERENPPKLDRDRFQAARLRSSTRMGTKLHGPKSGTLDLRADTHPT